jgi:hypothetical protein
MDNCAMTECFVRSVSDCVPNTLGKYNEEINRREKGGEAKSIYQLGTQRSRRDGKEMLSNFCRISISADVFPV